MSEETAGAGSRQDSDPAFGRDADAIATENALAVALDDAPGGRSHADAAAESDAGSDDGVTAAFDPQFVSGIALVAVVGGALLGLAHLSALALLIAVAVVQALVVVSWVFAARVPGKWGALVLGAAASAGADVAVSLSPHGQLGALLPVLGFAVPLMFAHQLTRGIARSRVVESLAKTALLVAAVVAVVALLQLRHEVSGPRVAAATVGCAALALVVGYLTDMTYPAARFDPAIPRGFVGVIAGAVAGAAVGYLQLRTLIEFQGARAAFLGFAIGLVVSLLAVGASFVQYVNPPGSSLLNRIRPIYGALLPLCFVCPIGYLLCLAIRG